MKCQRVSQISTQIKVFIESILSSKRESDPGKLKKFWLRRTTVVDAQARKWCGFLVVFDCSYSVVTSASVLRVNNEDQAQNFYQIR